VQELRCAMTRRLLMIAYHFPPLAGSSGIQRTLRFVQQLPTFGWTPMVLTTHPRAYERTSDDQMCDVPASTVVERAFALDTARHLSLSGRYIGAMARPDRWASWRFDAVRRGMQMIERYQPQAIWSTYPIATAHLIGAELQRRSGLPWLADFRDPMVQVDYPTDAPTWHAYKRIEERTVLQARVILFTTPGAAADCRSRYPAQAGRVQVLENGYDEESFAAAGQRVHADSTAGPHVLLHSGIVYPDERDPRQLMAALRILHDRGAIQPGKLIIRLRAAVHDDLIRQLAREYAVASYIEICPSVGYLAALQEMLEVDGLLVLQAANCNQQVPAKLYEYIRAGRPILCLTDPAGDTATVLREAGVSRTARLDSAEEIAALIAHHLKTGGVDLRPDALAVASSSRLQRTRQLAQILEQDHSKIAQTG